MLLEVLAALGAALVHVPATRTVGEFNELAAIADRSRHCADSAEKVPNLKVVANLPKYQRHL